MESIREIAYQKRQTLTQVAVELGTTDGHLRRLIKRETFASADLWRSIIRWSEGRVTPNDFFSEEIKEALEASEEGEPVAA